MSERFFGRYKLDRVGPQHDAQTPFALKIARDVARQYRHRRGTKGDQDGDGPLVGEEHGDEKAEHQHTRRPDDDRAEQRQQPRRKRQAKRHPIPSEFATKMPPTASRRISKPRRIEIAPLCFRERVEREPDDE